MREKPASLPKGITWDGRMAKPFLARFGHSGKHRKYFSTVDEAEEWLEENRGTILEESARRTHLNSMIKKVEEICRDVRTIHEQLSNYNRVLTEGEIDVIRNPLLLLDGLQREAREELESLSGTIRNLQSKKDP